MNEFTHSQETVAANTPDWESISKRYQEKIEKAGETLPDDSPRHGILNQVEQDIPLLFKKYKEKGFSLQQVQDDLQYRMSITKNTDPTQYQTYKTIWELTDARDIRYE